MLNHGFITHFKLFSNGISNGPNNIVDVKRVYKCNNYTGKYNNNFTNITYDFYCNQMCSWSP